MGQDEVEQIVRRIRSCELPVAAPGFWADEKGEYQEFIEPGHSLDLIEEGEAVA